MFSFRFALFTLYSNMRNIKLTIEYDGTDFNGWQVQSKKNRTVQGEIEKALYKILKKPTRIRGSGRTDSGVHAKAQIAHFKTATCIPCDSLCRALNTYLPDDVSILKVEDVDSKFHAQFDAKRKTYHYMILNRLEPGALNRQFCTHIPYKLNVSRMRRAAHHLVGRHDFRSFVAADSAKPSRQQNSIRTIYRCDVRKRGDYIFFEIEANGFLYKMVRNIVGTLIAVGCQKLSVEDIIQILKAKDRSRAGDTAPPQGLCLQIVRYA